MSGLAAEFQKLSQLKASAPDLQLPETVDVLCDICSEVKERAVKSCLMCLVSFCEAHLEPHQRVAGLKNHTLLEPLKNLEDRMCKTHSKVEELYCRTDSACVCVLCFKTSHKSHNVVPLEEEYEAVMAKKDKTMANIQKMIQSRSEKIAEFESSLEGCRRDAEKEKEASVLVFTDLIQSIQRSQAEHFEAIEERHTATRQKTEGFLAELKVEIAELESRSNQLEQLSQSADHHQFVQSFPTLCSPSNKDWAHIGVQSDLSLEAVRDDLTQLKQRVKEIMEELPEIKMKRIREHAVDLTLDPDTAFCTLIISQEGKHVKCTDTKQELPSNPKRFESYPDVLAKEGFTTGKFYYEVQVKGKTDWMVGVVTESVERKKEISLSDKKGAWIIGLDDGTYQAYSGKTGTITLKEELKKVGIFVDYNKRVVSFYNVNSKSHIYSFTYCQFTERLYPYFGLQGTENGKNSAPLIITPVPQSGHTDN